MTIRHLFILTAAILTATCGRSEEAAVPTPRSVTVYVSTDRVFSEPVLQEYQRRSGVTVNAVYDTEETKSTGLANRLLAEEARPQADVFWSNEPVRTLVLKSRNVLAPYRSPSAEGIPRCSAIRRATGRGFPHGCASSRTTRSW